MYATEGLLMESLEAVAFQLQAAKGIEAVEVRNLGQLVVRQVQEIQKICVKGIAGEDPERQCLQLVSGHIQDAVIQPETSEAVRMQLGQIVALQVKMLDDETCKDFWRQCLQLVLRDV